MDRDLVRGIAAGAILFAVLAALVGAEGTVLPRSSVARSDCACPDSTPIPSPRGILPR